MDFNPFEGDPKAEFELPYDFKLASFADANTDGATEPSASL